MGPSWITPIRIRGALDQNAEPNGTEKGRREERSGEKLYAVIGN